MSLHLEDTELRVGELVQEEKQIYFKYYPDFLEEGLQISPFKLPISSNILTPETMVFDGLFGVFHDSLPEGWGRLLLDRSLIEKGVALNEITALDRLAFVGKNGKGGLIYQPAIESEVDLEKQLELDEIATASYQVLEGSSSELLEELFQLGGSSGGARPKILVGYNKVQNKLIYGRENLPEGYEHWIIKFSSSTDKKDIAQIEYAYYKMALAAGLEMSECRLFKSESGNYFFGTKRFDRIGNERLHLHSAAGLMHDNFRLSSMDYGHLMDAAFRLENHVKAYEKILRLAAFNIFAHNRDDHSKNFSFLMNQKGEWKFTPAYDLTFSRSSHGFHSTTVAGEGKSPTQRHLVELAEVFGVKNVSEIINQVQEAIGDWKRFAIESGVTKSSTKSIAAVLNE
ncbi:MAG: type II toxin-antitoxin system HipA family toxin [Bacteroidota bacterium]